MSKQRAIDELSEPLRKEMEEACSARMGPARFRLGNVRDFEKLSAVAVEDFARLMAVEMGEVVHEFAYNAQLSMDKESRLSNLHRTRYDRLMQKILGSADLDKEELERDLEDREHGDLLEDNPDLLPNNYAMELDAQRDMLRYSNRTVLRNLDDGAAKKKDPAFFMVYAKFGNGQLQMLETTGSRRLRIFEETIFNAFKLKAETKQEQEEDEEELEKENQRKKASGEESKQEPLTSRFDLQATLFDLKLEGIKFKPTAPATKPKPRPATPVAPPRAPVSPTPAPPSSPSPSATPPSPSPSAAPPSPGPRSGGSRYMDELKRYASTPHRKRTPGAFPVTPHSAAHHTPSPSPSPSPTPAPKPPPVAPLSPGPKAAPKADVAPPGNLPGSTPLPKNPSTPEPPGSESTVLPDEKEQRNKGRYTLQGAMKNLYLQGKPASQWHQIFEYTRPFITEMREDMENRSHASIETKARIYRAYQGDSIVIRGVPIKLVRSAAEEGWLSRLKDDQEDEKTFARRFKAKMHEDAPKDIFKTDLPPTLKLRFPDDLKHTRQYPFLFYKRLAEAGDGLAMGRYKYLTFRELSRPDITDPLRLTVMNNLAMVQARHDGRSMYVDKSDKDQWCFYHACAGELNPVVWDRLIYEAASFTLQDLKQESDSYIAKLEADGITNANAVQTIDPFDIARHNVRLNHQQWSFYMQMNTLHWMSLHHCGINRPIAWAGAFAHDFLTSIAFFVGAKYAGSLFQPALQVGTVATMLATTLFVPVTSGFFSMMTTTFPSLGNWFEYTRRFGGASGFSSVFMMGIIGYFYGDYVKTNGVNNPETPGAIPSAPEMFSVDDVNIMPRAAQWAMREPYYGHYTLPGAMLTEGLVRAAVDHSFAKTADRLLKAPEKYASLLEAPERIHNELTRWWEQAPGMKKLMLDQGIVPPRQLGWDNRLSNDLPTISEIRANPKDFVAAMNVVSGAAAIQIETDLVKSPNFAHSYSITSGLHKAIVDDFGPDQTMWPLLVDSSSLLEQVQLANFNLGLVSPRNPTWEGPEVTNIALTPIIGFGKNPNATPFTHFDNCAYFYEKSNSDITLDGERLSINAFLEAYKKRNNLPGIDDAVRRTMERNSCKLRLSGFYNSSLAEIRAGVEGQKSKMIERPIVPIPVSKPFQEFLGGGKLVTVAEADEFLKTAEKISTQAGLQAQLLAMLSLDSIQMGNVAIVNSRVAAKTLSNSVAFWASLMPWNFSLKNSIFHKVVNAGAEKIVVQAAAGTIASLLKMIPLYGSTLGSFWTASTDKAIDYFYNYTILTYVADNVKQYMARVLDYRPHAAFASNLMMLDWLVSFGQSYVHRVRKGENWISFPGSDSNFFHGTWGPVMSTVFMLRESTADIQWRGSAMDFFSGVIGLALSPRSKKEEMGWTEYLLSAPRAINQRFFESEFNTFAKYAVMTSFLVTATHLIGKATSGWVKKLKQDELAEVLVKYNTLDEFDKQRTWKNRALIWTLATTSLLFRIGPVLFNMGLIQTRGGAFGLLAAYGSSFLLGQMGLSSDDPLPATLLGWTTWVLQGISTYYNLPFMAVSGFVSNLVLIVTLVTSMSAMLWVLKAVFSSIGMVDVASRMLYPIITGSIGRFWKWLKTWMPTESWLPIWVAVVLPALVQFKRDVWDSAADSEFATALQPSLRKAKPAPKEGTKALYSTVPLGDPVASVRARIGPLKAVLPDRSVSKAALRRTFYHRLPKPSFASLVPRQRPPRDGEPTGEEFLFGAFPLINEHDEITYAAPDALIEWRAVMARAAPAGKRFNGKIDRDPTILLQ
jgi:hypothetical protein